MQFNWEKFIDKTNEIAVNCRTKEEAIDFCKKMAEHGMNWCNGDSYTTDVCWDSYKEETSYSNRGEYGDFDFYKDEGYKILKWSDYMEKYPINYLKYGYVVEFENGELAMYMPTQEKIENGFDFGNEGRALYIKDFDKNLKYNYKKWNIYNIKKIYGYAKDISETLKLNILNRPLIWERPEEVKKMTVSEICKELGYKVEIIAEEK